jgi:hypothetical protein
VRGRRSERRIGAWRASDVAAKKTSRQPSAGHCRPAIRRRPLTAGAIAGSRVDVRPLKAVVVIDGDIAGIVEEFNGHFQHLTWCASRIDVNVLTPG